MQIFELLTHLGAPAWAPPLAAISLIIGVTTKILQGWLSFHDEHWQKRPYKKLAFLAKEVETNPKLKELVDAARNEQVYVVLMGRSASPNIIEAMHALWSTGEFSINELKAASPYLRTSDGQVKLEVGYGSVFLFWTVLGTVVLMGLMISAMVIPLLALQTPASLASAAILLAAYLWFMWFMGRDVRSVPVAKRLKSKIEAGLSRETGPRGVVHAVKSFDKPNNQA